MLEETRAMLEDQRQRAAHGFARSVEDRATTRDDGELLLARYQKTRVYRSAIALKGIRTRRRNTQAASEADEARGNFTRPVGSATD